MITLGPGESLEVSPSTTDPVHVTASWADHDHTPVSDYVPGGLSTDISVTGFTEVVPGPSGFPRRTLKAMTILVEGAMSITVAKHDGSFRALMLVLMQPGDTLEYEDAAGWKLLRSGALVGIGATGPQGPQGAIGPQGIQGLQGPVGPPRGVFEQEFITPMSTWVVNHNLGRVPAVTLVTLGGVEFSADVQHTSTNQCVVSLLSPFAGTVICG